MQKIDAHLHVVADHPDSLAVLEEFDLKLFNICVAHTQRDWHETERGPYARLTRDHPDRFGWCTSFDLPDFKDPDFADRAIAGIKTDFANGAVACKVWKNVGMELKDPDGRFVQVDHPIFEPIFEFLARQEWPLLAHIAEPLACWQPLVEGRPHYGYYSKNPQWHMHGRSDYPSHTEIIAARDRMIAKNPKLRIIGAHLGSLEHDVAEVAKRFDRFPNFFVDMSARLGDLMVQDPDTVREFFLRYPDRIIFGTDVVMRTPHSTLSPDERKDVCDQLRRVYQAHFSYFETKEVAEYSSQSSRGIALPPEVLEKFYRTNARTCYPGL